MQITLNGNIHKLESPATLEMLIKDLGINPRKVAIERNLCIVPSTEYSSIHLLEGDVLEVVQFIGGG